MEKYRGQEIARNFLEFQLNRNVINLAKAYLTSAEDLQFTHDIAIKKLKELLPEEYHRIIDASAFFSDVEFERLRKRILDAAGGTKKEIELLLERLEIEFQGNC